MGRCLYLREGCLFPGDDSAEVLESLRQNRDFRRRFFRQSRPKKRENAQRMHIKHSLGMRTVLRRDSGFALDSLHDGGAPGNRHPSRRHRQCPSAGSLFVPPVTLPQIHFYPKDLPHCLHLIASLPGQHNHMVRADPFHHIISVSHLDKAPVPAVRSRILDVFL